MKRKIKETIISTITEYFVKTLIGVTLILIVWFWDNILEWHKALLNTMLSNNTLSIVHILLILSFFIILSYNFYLRKKLKPKYLFDLIWRVKPHPECPKCKISLNYSIGTDESYPGLKCPKCGKSNDLKLNDKQYLELKEVQDSF